MLGKNKTNAKAKIRGGKKFPEINGEVTFKQTKEGVIVTAKINGLPTSNKKCQNNVFGFHIHEGTSCTGNKEDEFANAMSHYNPRKMQSSISCRRFATSI